MDIRRQEEVLADLLAGQTSQVDRVRQRRDRALAPPERRGATNTSSLSTRPAARNDGGERRAAFEQQRLRRPRRRARELVLERPAAQLELGAVRERPAAEREPARLPLGAHVRARSAAGRPRGPCPSRPRPRPTPRAARGRAAGSPRPRPSASPGTVDAAVERHRDLVGDERAAARDPGAPGLVLARAPPSESATLDLDAGRPQPLEAPPSTFGFGSRAPATTRAMPAASTASTHGGVRPWWAQGSSVT